MPKRLTTEEFIIKAKCVHGDKYDYSLAEYISAHKKIKIICHIHGEFEQISNDHLHGGKCQICAILKRSKKKTLTTEEFIRRAKVVHDNNYDYSLTKYIKNRLKVKIECYIHGEFEQRPNDHLNGSGCPKCAVIKVHNDCKKTTEKFIDDANLIHRNKYCYLLTEYINCKLKVKIECFIHGIFEQRPNDHLNGEGCPECGLEKIINNITLSTEEFIKRANLIHNNFYDYSITNYVNAHKKIKIICPTHGIFEQIPNDHLNNCGCTKCVESMGERKIRNILDQNHIKYVSGKRFKNCKNKKPLPFDFHLPDYNALVEHDGEQHFKPVKYFGGEVGFKSRQINDEIKNKFAKENNYTLLRISYLENVEEKLSAFLQL